jgi:hypothetical protein
MGAPRQGLAEECGVVGEVLLLVLWQIRFVIDRIHSANRFARTAIHALGWIDVKGTSAFVDAVDGTFLHTRLVCDVYTRAADYVGHDRSVSAAVSSRLRQEGPFPWGLKAFLGMPTSSGHDQRFLQLQAKVDSGLGSGPNRKRRPEMETGLMRT